MGRIRRFILLLSCLDVLFDQGFGHTFQVRQSSSHIRKNLAKPLKALFFLLRCILGWKHTRPIRHQSYNNTPLLKERFSSFHLSQSSFSGMHTFVPCNAVFQLVTVFLSMRYYSAWSIQIIHVSFNASLYAPRAHTS